MYFFVYTYVYIYIHMCAMQCNVMYVCVYECIYLYTHTWLNMVEQKGPNTLFRRISMTAVFNPPKKQRTGKDDMGGSSSFWGYPQIAGWLLLGKIPIF